MKKRTKKKKTKIPKLKSWNQKKSMVRMMRSGENEEQRALQNFECDSSAKCCSLVYNAWVERESFFLF